MMSCSLRARAVALSYVTVTLLTLAVRAPAAAATTTVSMVADTNPGPGGSGVFDLADAGGTLYFEATDGASGTEPWLSDGTQAGTRRLKDLAPGPGSSWPFGFTALGDIVVFFASDPVHGQELWRTDGTNAGTVLLQDIRPGTGHGTLRGYDMVVLDDILYFVGNDGVTGAELWRTDGTTSGTYLVADIDPGNDTREPEDMTVLGSEIMFSAFTWEAGTELWKTDGTAAGTVLVADIDPEASSNPRYLTTSGDLVFFRADDGVHFDELWKSDGTATGTSMVKDIAVGSGGLLGTGVSSSPYELTDVNGTLFFVAHDDEAGWELWKSDGTAAGTTRVTDLTPGRDPSFDSGDENLTALGSRLFFRATSPLTGYELWVTDGTSAGTHVVKDIAIGTSHSSPAFMRAAAGSVFFRAADDLHGFEVWQTDGSEAGTAMVRDIMPGGEDSVFDTRFAVSSGTVFFGADDGISGRELWSTDGPVDGNHPPACARATAMPESLWRPNHRFVPVSIAVPDADGDAVATTVTKVTQDEPVVGSDSTSPDALGVGTSSLELRAERNEAADGRVYRVGIRATDARGATCTGVVRVIVPISKGGTAVEGSERYDSTAA